VIISFIIDTKSAWRKTCHRKQNNQVHVSASRLILLIKKLITSKVTIYFQTIQNPAKTNQ